MINRLPYNKNMIFTVQEVKDYKKYFDRVKNIFNHQEDIILYELILEVRKTNDATKMDSFQCNNRKRFQKEYLDFINPQLIKVVIEGGVHNGSNTVDFLYSLPEGVTIYGFEPFIEIFKNSKHRSFLEKNKNIIIYSLGLWDKKDKLEFYKDKTDERASKIIVNKQNIKFTKLDVIETVSIDEFVQDKDIKKIDFIKLDIEGAELNTLKGAINTLKGNRPQLAICIYHSKKDFFEIPLFLNEILENYEYRLGQYAEAYWDTVLYGIPKEALTNME
jgi:FkbM family methyltransferase